MIVLEAVLYYILGFARKYADNVDVDKRWKEWIEFETSIITNYGKNETIHG
jgi:tRNA-(ms[2]io[6]A)-hydroxylase